MSFKVSSILLVIFAIAIMTVTAFYIKPEDINPQTYCGINAYPGTVAPLPPLNSKSRQLGLKPLDQHIFFRHGDRSTIAAKCFAGVQGFADKVWTECPNPIYNNHHGLKNRTSGNQLYDRDYRFNVEPYPHKNILDGNCHFGQLTQRGTMMSYNNGQRYAKYLNLTQPGPISLTQFKARSTDVHRTRETGTSFLTGLLDSLVSAYTLPSNFTQIANIPNFQFVDNKVDALAMNDNMCSTKAYLEQAYKDPKWIEYLDTVYNPLQQNLNNLLNNTQEVYDVFDCAKTLYCHNNPLPEGLEQYHTQMEAALLNYYLQSYNYNHTLANILYTGVHATEMLPHFFNMNNMTYSGRQFYLYSGHDSNVQSMLSLLQFGIQTWPPYSALLQIEFYRTKDNKSTYVRFIYDNEIVVPEFCKTNIINGELCPIEGLIELYTKSLPKNGECQGIPRQNIDDLRNAFIQHDQLATNGETTTLLTNIAENNIKDFLQHMNDLQLQQQQQEELLNAVGGVKEISDVERWAKWAGQ